MDQRTLQALAAGQRQKVSELKTLVERMTSKTLKARENLSQAEQSLADAFRRLEEAEEDLTAMEANAGAFEPLVVDEGPKASAYDATIRTEGNNDGLV